MALEVHIPKEILEHKDKFFFGLTIRQLICICIPGIIAICSYYAMYTHKLNKDIITNLISFIFIPFISFGFFEPRGYKLEEYFKIIYNHRYAQRKKYYATSDNLSKFYIRPIKVKKEFLSEKKNVAVVIDVKKNRKEDKLSYKVAKKSFKLAIKAAKKTKKLSATKSQTMEPVYASAAVPMPMESIHTLSTEILHTPAALMTQKLISKEKEILGDSFHIPPQFISRKTDFIDSQPQVNTPINSKKILNAKTKEKRIIQLH